MNSFRDRLEVYRVAVSTSLSAAFPACDQQPEARIAEAARYSLLGGGKRIRPAMMLASGEMLGLDDSEVMPFACAIEMIHTYSLIHDDLPCMDDDELRRGRRTCHVEFDEATAMLAGDALLNRAFEILLSTCLSARPEDQAKQLAAANRIAKAAGFSGMIGGQAIDMRYEGEKADRTIIQRMHRMKTGALFTASMLVPFDLSVVPETAGIAMGGYADAVGMAFQIKDDLLDVTATAVELGKTPGKDERSGKTTYVTLYGTAEAEMMLTAELHTARGALEVLEDSGLDTTFFAGMANYLQERKS